MGFLLICKKNLIWIITAGTNIDRKKNWMEALAVLSMQDFKKKKRKKETWCVYMHLFLDSKT